MVEQLSLFSDYNFYISKTCKKVEKFRFGELGLLNLSNDTRRKSEMYLHTCWWESVNTGHNSQLLKIIDSRIKYINDVHSWC